MENIQPVVNNGIDPFNLSGGIGLSEQDVFSTIVDNNPTQNSAMTSGVESLAIPSIQESAEVFSDGIVSNTLDSSFRLMTANALSNNPDIDSLTGTKNNQSIVSELNTDPLINPHNINSANSPPIPLFDSGVFTVGETGQVNIDFLFDAGGYQGELAIFSLTGIEAFELGSTAFIQEAARRALSNSELGHVVISDRTEGAKFSGVLGEHENRDWGAGDYLGVKTFAMRPGDEFGFMLIPNGKVQQVFNNPNVGGAKSPVFSMATANRHGTIQFAQIVDVEADGNSFVFEDISLNRGSDRDYNDLIFQVQGAMGKADLLNDVINPATDWRNSDLGQELIIYTASNENGPLSNMGSDLAQVFVEYETYLRNGGAPSSFEPTNFLLQVQDGQIVIDAVASDDPNTLFADLTALGLQQGAIFESVVSGLLPIEAINEV